MGKEKKKTKASKIILNTVFFTIIGLMVAFYTWNFIDIRSGYKYPIFGLRTSVIVSPSMAGVHDDNTYITEDMKQIQQYDVVTTKQYQSFDEIQIYDVATYYNGSKDLICHRVVDKYIYEGKQYVVFRGDANNVDDVPVSYDLVRGKVISVTPKVGHVVAFIQSPYLFIAIFGTVFFVALALFIVGFKKDNKKENEPEQTEEQNNNDSIEETQPVEESPDSNNNEDVQVNNEEPVEEPAQEEQPQEESIEEPVEEEKVEESTNEEEQEEVPTQEVVEPLKEEKKEKPKAKEEKPAEKKEVNFRTYHVNKRKEDGKWTVKYAGGEKVIKLFDTQKEALEYTKKMAENQGGTVLVHASKGAQKGKIKKK